MSEVALRAVVVAGICTSRNRVALVRRSLTDAHLPGAWGVPCGHVRDDEDPETALRREMREEAGLVFAHARLLGTSSYRETLAGRPLPVLQLNYLLLDVHGQLSPRTSDIADAKWIPYDEISSAPWIDAYTRAVLAQLPELRPYAGS